MAGRTARPETNAARSRIMAMVKDRDTGPELFVRRLVWRMGYRYRLHGKTLPGKPDLVFAGRKKVIFVHGCYWHGHSCKRGARMPKTNSEYWAQKISGNRERDIRHAHDLAAMGWRSLVLWECELNVPAAKLAMRIKKFLDK
ncbi:very short patch repair endonuclease [soil metagenome]